jgi:hypothetical protein
MLPATDREERLAASRNRRKKKVKQRAEIEERKRLADNRNRRKTEREELAGSILSVYADRAGILTEKKGR